MLKKNITIVIGTRPEAIKLAPLIIGLQKNSKINIRIILTGQHREMVDQVLDVFKIKASVDLNIMSKNQSLNNIAISILEGVMNEINKYPPDLILVQGDTNSAFISALAAFYEKIPIGHVEAGLRSNELWNPYPEEANRKLISQISTLNFAPTLKALDNLETSSVNGKNFLTGNTIVDALNLTISKEHDFQYEWPQFEDSKVLLITIHRRENWGKNLLQFIKAFKTILVENEGVKIILPMHKNPVVRDPILKELRGNERISLIEPLRYDEFAYVLKRCYLILTDSGGIQEEAPTFNKPVLVLRETTERVEAIDNNTAMLVGTDIDSIVKNTNKLIQDNDFYLSMTSSQNPFGDGKATERIIKECENFLNVNKKS